MLSMIKKGLFALVLFTGLMLSKGCTVSIDGLGDLLDYLPIIVVGDDCDYCGYDVIEIEYDD